MASCQTSVCVGTTTPSASPITFSSPATPSYTPCCTPRRLSLSLSLAESSTNLRDSTKTTSTSLGLVHLLLERGISASVYDPWSWDRGADASGASTPTGAGGGGGGGGGGGQPPRIADRRTEVEDGQVERQASTLLPSTPPNSPMRRSRSKSASSPAAPPVFQFSPSRDDPPYYDTFLASKPARTILREVLGEAEKERGGGQADGESQAEVLNLRLVDKLKRFRTLSPLGASNSPGGALLAPFGSPGLGSGALGGGLPVLNAGLRRNRSYPAMVGASMAMKDPGGPHSTEILIPHTLQTPHTQHRTHAPEVDRTLTAHAQDTPQTIRAQETVVPQAIPRGRAGPDDERCSTFSLDRPAATKTKSGRE